MTTARTAGQRTPDTLDRTRSFWNASPCGAQDDFRERVEHRYAVEPWVADVLQAIASAHWHVVEIGCGQGTDGIRLCELLPLGGSYVGIDYSDDSIKAATQSLRDAADSTPLRIEPVFRIGNAEQLEFDNDTLSCVYSNGVLHHTPDPERAISEIRRVLKPGGEAFIALYRKPSLKVLVAKAMRGAQAVVDAVTGVDRSFYRAVSGRNTPKLLGTMLLEGVGVPVMCWYSAREIRGLFRAWDILTIDRVGCNIPRRHPASRGWTRWGYMWLLHVRKPAPHDSIPMRGHR